MKLNVKIFLTQKRRQNVKSILSIALIIVIIFFLLGCAGMTETQQRTLSGGAIGGVAGAGIAAIAGGSVWVGAAVGHVGGAITGYIIGKSHERKRYRKTKRYHTREVHSHQ
jgi:osmotically inducible lipoprotein OsmB